MGWDGEKKRSSLELSLNYLPMELVAETSSALQQQLVAHPLDTISLLPFSETTPSGDSVKTADESHKKNALCFRASRLLLVENFFCIFLAEEQKLTGQQEPLKI